MSNPTSHPERPWFHDIESHPAADAFPLLQGVKWDQFAESVRSVGKIEVPVLTTCQCCPPELLVDGRHRIKAAIAAGLKWVPRESLPHDEDVIGVVVRRNIDRRHLDESARAQVADRLSALSKQGPNPANLQDCPTVEEAAGMLNVSPRSVSAARKVRLSGNEALIGAVEQGRVKVSDAATVADAPVDVVEEALDAMEAPPEGVGKQSFSTAQKAVGWVRRRRHREEAQAAPAPPADERALVYQADIRNPAEWPERGSVDIVFTDPPYPREFLPLLADLRDYAAAVLRPGGDLLVMMGTNHLDEAFERLRGGGGAGLVYNDTLSMRLTGANSLLFRSKTFSRWKPIIWYRKGGLVSGEWAPNEIEPMGVEVDGDIEAGAQDQHKWGQSTHAAQAVIAPHIVRHQAAGKGGIVVADPFCGAGALPVAALREGAARVVASDVAPEHCHTTRGNIHSELHPTVR